MQLYPWLSVSEVSNNVVAEGLLASTTNTTKSVDNPAQNVAAEQGAPRKEKKGLFSRLFRK